MPKPMIPCNKRTIIEYALDPFFLPEANIIFIVRKQHVLDYSIDLFLKQKFGENITIIELDHLTEGALCTCLLSEEYVDKSLPLVIYTPDVTFAPEFNFDRFVQYDAALLTFKANSPAHSYARLNDEGLVVETKEKQVISDNAAVGLYYFNDTSLFFERAKKMIENKEKTKNEYYICPLYNYYTNDKKVGAILTEKLYVLGTPEELEFYETNVLYDDICIGLCSDHSGYKAKEIMKAILDFNKIRYIDYGTFSNRDCDYNTYVKQAAIQLKKKYVTTVFGSCRTGQGVNICANKIPGIRSCVVYDENACEHAIRHNCCNFFSFPEKDITPDLFRKYLKVFLTNTFDGGRHYTRISSNDS